MFGYFLVIAAMFAAIVLRLANMQLTQYEDYVTQAETKSQKTYSLYGKR